MSGDGAVVLVAFVASSIPDEPLLPDCVEMPSSSGGGVIFVAFEASSKPDEPLLPDSGVDVSQAAVAVKSRPIAANFVANTAMSFLPCGGRGYISSQHY